MGNVGFDNLKELALALRDQYGITTFIETGTYKAQTTQWAVTEFDRVVSIELDEGWHKRAMGQLIKHKNVKLLLGDSGQELAKVLKRLKKPALIWLDAHWCKVEKATRPECPLREELAAIRESGVEHFILIDDARLFENPSNSDWPTMGEINKLFPYGYKMTIWNDAIIAVPSKALKVVSNITTETASKPPTQKLEPVVLTSNNYLRCLPPFAYLFNKFWSKEQAVKVVRYEIRPHNLPANFTNYAIGKQGDYTWSSGLIKFLNDYQGDLILLMLEDYFLDRRVETGMIEWAWGHMLHHPEIAKFDLTNDRLKVAHERHTDQIIKSASGAAFQTSVQAAIWRKDFLLRFLDPKENAWQFEKQGTRRVIEAREKGELEGLILGFRQPPMSYINAVGGEGQNSDKWDHKKFPSDMWNELAGRGLV